METLPPEIVLTILEYCVANHYGDKNSLLSLRTVCKLFDHVLKPFVLQTLQLEFTRLDKVSRSCRLPDETALRRIGHLCQALYLDLMVIRDDGNSVLFYFYFLLFLFHKSNVYMSFYAQERSDISARSSPGSPPWASSSTPCATATA